MEFFIYLLNRSRMRIELPHSTTATFSPSAENKVIKE